MSAFIVMDGVRYFSRIFFVEGGDKDFMGAAWKNPGADEPWHLDYRIRYYATAGLTWGEGNNDRRSEYSMMLEPGFELETSDVRQIRRMMERESWAHFKEMKP